MPEMDHIADEVDRMTHGGAWHGPAMSEALSGVSAAEASARPIPGAHTIWEIVLHMTAWAGEVTRRLWDNATPLSGEADWPTVSAQDDLSWKETKAALVDAHRNLRQAIREFPPARLHHRASPQEDDPPDSFYVMLHGLAQHDAYHTGQIAILKKAMARR